MAGATAAAIFSRPKPDPDRLWEQARADWEADRLDRLGVALGRLEQLRAPTPEDRMLRGQLARAGGRLEEALAEMGRIPDDSPLGPFARLQMGEMELRRDRLRPAEAHLLRALELNPTLIPARRQLIYMYGMQLRRRALSEQFRALAKLSTLTPEDVWLWCMASDLIWWNADETIPALRRYVQADPDDRWSRLALVELLGRSNRREEMERELAVLPASDPDALAVRARLALERGDEAAEARLAEGPADHPELARLRGRLALSRRDGAAAVRHFRDADNAEPHRRETVFGLANALRMVGDDKAADARQGEAKGIDTLSSLLLRVERGAAWRGVGPDRLVDLGAACEAAHRLPEARAWYRLAITRDPLNAAAQHALFRLQEDDPVDRSSAQGVGLSPGPGMGLGSGAGPAALTRRLGSGP